VGGREWVCELRHLGEAHRALIDGSPRREANATPRVWGRSGTTDLRQKRPGKPGPTAELSERKRRRSVGERRLSVASIDPDPHLLKRRASARGFIPASGDIPMPLEPLPVSS
jgi:hypothetical protein